MPRPKNCTTCQHATNLRGIFGPTCRLSFLHASTTIRLGQCNYLEKPENLISFVLRRFNTWLRGR